MVGLIRDTCPAFKRDQRIRPKTILFSAFSACLAIALATAGVLERPKGVGESKTKRLFRIT